jgi:NhaP-type Na+/H+ or K+/H+ antiporter
METPYDWITVALFAGLIVVFLQRSVGDQPSDSALNYLPPAIGCALANYLGNEGYHAFAIVGIVAIMAYIFYVIDPLNRRAR